MKAAIKYVELKSGFADSDLAWIGLVSFSKSGKTVYFDGKALQRSNGMGIAGNYYDLETGDEYWVSGVKKNMRDRHQFGSGTIFVEKCILADYLKIVDKDKLPKGYEVVEVDSEIPVLRIYELEN